MNKQNVKPFMNNFTFGFELEGGFDRTCTESSSVRTLLDEMLGVDGNMHGDGSLHFNNPYQPFEYSSGVLALTPSNLNRMLKCLDSLPANHILVNRSCGFHVHFSYNGVTKLDATWAVFALIVSGNFRKFLKLGRTNLFKEQWAATKYAKDSQTCFERGDYQRAINEIILNEKYRCFHIHPQGTIEWRGPRTFLNVNKHSKNISFIKKLYEFAIELNKMAHLTEINGYTKSQFIIDSERNLNRLSFRTRDKLNVESLSKLFNKIGGDNKNIINNLPLKFFVNLKNNWDSLKNNRDTYQENKLFEQMHTFIFGDNYKIQNVHFYETFINIISTDTIIKKIDLETFKKCVGVFGKAKLLTKMFCILLENQHYNKPVLEYLLKEIMYNFGNSNMKTFHKNAVIKLLDNGSTQHIKHIATKNIVQLYGEDYFNNILKNIFKLYTSSAIAVSCPEITALLNSENAPHVNMFLQNNVNPSTIRRANVLTELGTMVSNSITTTEEVIPMFIDDCEDIE